jgi:hypothetical protein
MRIDKVWSFAAVGAVALISMQPLARAGDDKTVLDTGTTATDTGHYSRFPFHVTVGVRGGYDDNVLTTTFDRKASWFTNGSLGLTYTAGNPRTQISLSAGGGVTYYFDRGTDRDYDLNANLSLTITHKPSPRLSLAASVYATYQVEPDFNLAVGLTRRNGNYFYTADKFSVAFQWAPRFATVTSYTFGAVNYENSIVSAFEDRFEHTFSNEFRFLLLPTTSLVGEYRFMVVDYDQALDRDSTTHFFLAGLDHSFSQRFNVSVRAGAENRQYDVGGDRTEPYFEGTLNYALGHRTSVSWTTRYAIEEPDVPGSASRTTFRTGVQVAYGITSRITSTLGAYYQHDDNEGVDTTTVVSPAFAEDSFDIALAIRYAINRNFAVEAGYTHTEVVSDILLREYSRNRYFMGLALTF